MKVEIFTNVGIAYLWIGWAWTIIFALPEEAHWSWLGFLQMVYHSLKQILMWPYMLWLAVRKRRSDSA